MGNLTNNLSLGAEVYYTAKEKSGGLSIGTRFRRYCKGAIQSVNTLVVNPIMGHVSLSYSTSIQSFMTMTTRYDVNFYSFYSDISVGVEVCPPEQDQLLQAKFSLTDVRESNYSILIFFIIGFWIQFIREGK